jgi:hypothetical protein
LIVSVTALSRPPYQNTLLNMETAVGAFLICYGKTVNAEWIPVLRFRLNPPLASMSRKIKEEKAKIKNAK